MSKGRTIGCKFKPYCIDCRMITRKQKHRAGLDVERKLVSKAWKKGMVAIRFAGSGSGTSNYPKSDVALFDKGQIFIIEYKTTRPNQLPIRFNWKEYDAKKHTRGFYRTYEIAEAFFKNNFKNITPILRLKVFIPCKKNNVIIDATIKKNKDITFDFSNWEVLEKGTKFKDLKLEYEYKDNYWEELKRKEEEERNANAN